VRSGMRETACSAGSIRQRIPAGDASGDDA
jgi:hypothetical protein